MEKVYYKPMRNAALAVTCAFAVVLSPSLAQQQQPSTPMRASSVDSHEGMTIAVEALTNADQYKAAFPKKNPFASGVIALRVMFRNESADSIRVNLNRIRLSLTLEDESRQEIPALTSEEVADVVFTSKVKDPSRRTRLPIPLPSSNKIGRDKNWTELAKAAEEASVRNSVVAPHSTTEGFLYFDLHGQNELLTNARLYIPELVALEKNQALLYFDIDLSRTAPR
ncbi:MAG: hypothetical protein NVS9B14_09890 [Candidatus Acidiferrum sp.]